MRKIKNLIKNFIPEGLRGFKHKLRNIFVRLETLERNQVSLLRERYDAEYKSELNNKEFKVFSQNGEDGILLYIFSKIGIKNKTVVEIGIEEGKECNSANLVINFGWNGLLVEADNDEVLKARHYYKHVKGIPESRLKIAESFVNTENVNDVIRENGIDGEIDMLSIDIDGNDYWILEKVDLNPRLIVMEYNASIPADKSITVPYDPKFNRFDTHYMYHGASLAALNKLAKKKGYVLVGCDSTGCNAFFVRKDLAKGKFKEISVEDAFYPQIYRMKSCSLQGQFDKIKDFEWQEI
tara:strand:+ start:2713 stop:3597 length:885 start_codon:yes stop_codon:yes gene_type:complete